VTAQDVEVDTSRAVIDRPYSLGILVITFAMESLQVVSRDRHLEVAEDGSRPDNFVIGNVTEHVLIASLLSG